MFLTTAVNAQTDTAYYIPIKWLTWQEAMTLNAFSPKKVFVFVETDSNQYCHKMDTVTFQDSIVKYYLNSGYYPVKLNAQSKDTIFYKGYNLIYREMPDTNIGYHDLARGILESNLIFPGIVIFDEEMLRLKILHGYINPNVISGWLAYYWHNEHLKKNPINFGAGMNYQCNDPNHPHNRLRNLDKQMQNSDKNW